MERKTVAALARALGVSRSSLYYGKKRPEQDWNLKIRIEEILHEHPGYGHRRIAPLLRANKKRVLRVMQLYGIKPYRRRPKRKRRKQKSDLPPFENLLLRVPFPSAPNEIWVSDFTELRFHGRKFYLATVLDLFTRQIVGWNVLLNHTAELVLGTLKEALATTNAIPVIAHSDQGSEYLSRQYIEYAASQRIRRSMSRRARRGRTATRRRSTRSSSSISGTLTASRRSASSSRRSRSRSTTTTPAASTRN